MRFLDRYTFPPVPNDAYWLVKFRIGFSGTSVPVGDLRAVAQDLISRYSQLPLVCTSVSWNDYCGPPSAEFIFRCYYLENTEEDAVRLIRSIVHARMGFPGKKYYDLSHRVELSNA